MITQEKFINYIEYIRFLLVLVDDNRNHNHIKSIIKELEKSFPISESGFSEIEFYIFSQNFGKPLTDSEYESPEQFYNRLIDEQKRVI